MDYRLDFTHQISYDSLDETGIQVPIRLVFGDQSVKLSAKLDTGAQNCIFKREYGERLGIDVLSGRGVTFSGAAGGTFKAYGHTVTLETCDFQFDAEVFFVDFYEFRRDILGRIGWINRVRLGLLEYDSQLYLAKHEGL